MPQELNWLHAAVALQYGGLKAEFGATRAPKDVIELQKLCDQAVKNYEGRIAVPAGFIRRVTVGEADVEEAVAWYLELDGCDSVETPYGSFGWSDLSEDDLGVEETAHFRTAELLLGQEAVSPFGLYTQTVPR